MKVVLSFEENEMLKNMGSGQALEPIVNLMKLSQIVDNNDKRLQRDKDFVK